MLFTFLAFAVAVTLVIERGLLDKTLIVLSAVPIALAANIMNQPDEVVQGANLTLLVAKRPAEGLSPAEGTAS